MRISEEQGIQQLRPLIEALIPLPIQWLPFTSIRDDYDVLEWVRHDDNEWCSGKKSDFEFLLGKAIEYTPGAYSRTVLLVLGIRVG